MAQVVCASRWAGQAMEGEWASQSLGRSSASLVSKHAQSQRAPASPPSIAWRRSRAFPVHPSERRRLVLVMMPFGCMSETRQSADWNGALRITGNSRCAASRLALRDMPVYSRGG